MDDPATRNSSLVGVGLYTIPEAARLTGIVPGRLRRWLRGYAFGVGENASVSAPVWPRQLPEIDGTLGLGFLDLMEARFVDAFRMHSVSWRTIRSCAERAREIIGSDHPFSTRRFQTDGRTIFAEVVDEAGERHLLDLARSQFAFGRIIGPSLYAGLEFAPGDRLARWWPLGQSNPVVLDPMRSFGQPIVSDGGVPTRTLADAAEAEGSIAKVARLFRLAPGSVRAAVRYERRLTERLAA